MMGTILKKIQNRRTSKKKFQPAGNFETISHKDINTTVQSVSGARINVNFSFSSVTDLIDGQRVLFKRDKDREYNIERSRKSLTGINNYLCREVA